MLGIQKGLQKPSLASLVKKGLRVEEDLCLRPQRAATSQSRASEVDPYTFVRLGACHCVQAPASWGRGILLSLALDWQPGLLRDKLKWLLGQVPPLGHAFALLASSSAEGRWGLCCHPAPSGLIAKPAAENLAAAPRGMWGGEEGGGERRRALWPTWVVGGKAMPLPCLAVKALQP